MTTIRRAVNRSVLECTVGDIAGQRGLDAVVNAANAQLRPGGGVAGALHRAAGPGLEAECRPLAPIRVGQAAITGGHRLPNRWVVHVLGPVYGHDQPSDELLATSYRNALRVAASKGVESIGFPSLSTGVFGYPMEEAAPIAIRTVVEELKGETPIRLVRFVLYDERAFAIHARAVESILAC
ncbi:MAG: macro domain-containing protein [Acidobacteriota bacterium]|nr:MAG: RNase III inhibitor [Acidobacteriota bacterium]